MLTWQKIDELVQRAGQPLENELENLQGRFLGSERRNYYRFLYLLALEARPAMCLEIGVEFGVASAHMCAAAASYGGQVIGIDLNPHEIPSTRLDEWYGNYHFLLGNSTADETLRAVADLVKRWGRIGLVYQDSSHHYWPTKAEWEAYQPYLADETVWVCDDITPAFHDPKVDPPGKGMVQFWEELPVTNKRLYQDVLNYGNTQGIILYG